MSKISMEKICPVCKNIFQYTSRNKKTFCSKSCANTRPNAQKKMRIEKRCMECDAVFFVPKYRKDTALFCSGKCRSTEIYRLYLKDAPRHDMRGNKYRVGLKPAYSYPKGHIPWNKDLKGLHHSPETEFKKGRESPERESIGAEKLRNHRGVNRWWVKIAAPDVWELRARVVWEKHNGKIPKGKLIHHDDRDTENDDIGNLRCLTRAEHMKEHRDEIRAVHAVTGVPFTAEKVVAA